MSRATAFALLVVASAPWAGAEPAVRASAAVGAVTFPAGRAAQRELKFALGDDPGAAVRAIAQDALRIREAFEDAGSPAPEWELRLAIRDARQELTDRADVVGVGRSDRSVLQGAGTPPSRVELHVELVAEWARGGAVRRTTEIVKERRFEVEGRPRRADLRDGWDELIRAAVQEAFGEAYDAGAFDEAR